MPDLLCVCALRFARPYCLQPIWFSTEECDDCICSDDEVFRDFIILTVSIGRVMLNIKAIFKEKRRVIR